MIKQLAHVCIGATDLAESERFYTEILGLKKKFEFVKDDKPYGFYVDLGGTTFIEVFIQNDEANYERPIIRHLCLEVEDIDQFIETVRSHNWEVTDKKQGRDQSWQCWVKDPSGVAIEVQEYTENSSQFTGNTCIVDW